MIKKTHLLKLIPSAGILISLIIFLSACKKDHDPGLNSDENLTTVPVFTGNESGTAFVSNQVLLKFKKGTDYELMPSIYARVGGKLEEIILTQPMKEAGDKYGIYLINVPINIFDAINQLKSMPEVEFAEPNYIYTHFTSDTYYSSLWGMLGDAISPYNQYGSQANEAWAAGNTGSSGVIIAVIDEGIMNTHEDLAANCWINPNDAVDGVDNDGNGYKDDKWGWDFVGNNNTTFDGVGDDHATHVAGTIGAIANNGKGVVGVNWNIKMISCKFLGATGGTTANAIKAVDYVTDLKTRNGLNIVATNNSWGGGGFSQGLKDAIDRAGAQNILFIAAAGNSGTNNDATTSYPSGYTSSNIIAVAALASNGTLASYSQYGATTVDIGAPGSGIISSIPVAGAKVKGKATVVSGYGNYSGTSMATPHVTGGAALYAATHSGSSAAAIKAAIMSSAAATSSLSGKCVSNGRLNVSGF